MKKLSALFICLLLLITCGLAGCAGFKIDKVKYYNEVVAKVGDTNITRYELISAYNSYGQSYYVSQLGQNEEEAMKNTLDLLIDRESLYQYALDNNSKYKPTEYQVNSLVEEMFESLDSQMETYVEKAKTILGIKSEEIEEETEKDNSPLLLKDYTYSPRAKVVPSKTTFYTDASKTQESATETKYFTTKYKIEYIIEEEPISYDKLIHQDYLKDFNKSGIVEELKTKYLARFEQNLETNEGENAGKIYSKTISLFADSLMDYEYYLRDTNGKEFSKNTNDLLSRFFKRTFDSEIKSLYLENVRTEFVRKPENLSIANLIEEYKILSAISYNQYKYDHDAYKTAMKDIGTKGDTILYHPTLEDAADGKESTRFGYFIHTLINFSDAQKNKIKALEGEKDETKKETQYNAIISETTAKPRNSETGLIDEDAASVGLANIIAEYNEITAIGDYNEKMSKFIEFMFKYTGDTGTLSAGMPYVVGTNGHSAMEEAFTNESIKLMQTNVDGAMSNVSLNNIDSMCITSYGIHFVFYVGDVNSYDIPYGDMQGAYIQSMNKENDVNGALNLYHKTLNPLTNKTYFDMLFDTVYPAGSAEEVYSSNNGYSDHEETLIQISQAKHKVVKFATKIKSTKTNI